MKRETRDKMRVLTLDEINFVSGGGVSGGMGPVSTPIAKFQDMWGDTMSYEDYMDWIIGKVPRPGEGDGPSSGRLDAENGPGGDPHDFPNRP